MDNPILKQKFKDYDAGIFKTKLEDLRESLTEMTDLQCDDHLMLWIRGNPWYHHGYVSGFEA